MVRAYNLAVMLGASFAGQLKPLDHYLTAVDDSTRGGGALLGVLLALKEKGVPMKITQRQRKAG